MLTLINTTPTQYITTNPSDLTTITQPHTILTQTIHHQKYSHTFQTTSNKITLPTPTTTKITNTSTTTYIITLT